jgi:hypothetical protein
MSTDTIKPMFADFELKTDKLEDENLKIFCLCHT